MEMHWCRCLLLLFLVFLSCHQAEKAGGNAPGMEAGPDSCLDHRLTTWFLHFNHFQEEGHALAIADELAWKSTELEYVSCIISRDQTRPIAHSRMGKKEKY